MKRILFFACFLGAGYMANAQVGIGTSKPSPSAMLHIKADDKGVLIPSVALTSETNFAPITGNGAEAEGLLVYNVGTDLDKGFYFWKDQKWNKVIDKLSLQETISTVVSGDVGELKRIADYLIPTNPNSKDKTKRQAVLILDPVDKKVYSVFYNETTRQYDRSVVESEFKEYVQGLETRTLLKRAKIVTDGQIPAWTEVTTAPVAADVKAGQIFYQYLGEDNRIDYLNLTDDVTTIITNNDIVQKQITNILNKGGNVYFTSVVDGTIPANSLYQVDPETKERTIIDISSNVFNSIKEHIQNIKNEVGDKITNNNVVNTGNKIDGFDVLLFKTTTQIDGAEATGFTVQVPEENARIERIVNIKLFDSTSKNFVSDTVTDIVITGLNVKFNLGHGNFYLPLPTGRYEVIVEFTVSAY